MSDQLQWVPVGGGCLALGHRPKLKSIPGLHQQGTTHILTLLSESEGAGVIGHAARKAEIAWLWLPLESAEPPGKERGAAVRQLYEEVRAVLGTGAKVFVHCSAGIHRTGMIAYGLLRHLGQSSDQSMATLGLLRSHTQENVGAHRIALGDQFGDPAPG